MAERVIRIILDANDLKKGLDQVKGKMKGVGDQTKKTGESMRALRSVAGGLLAALSVRELGRAADAYTNIGNRIRLVTDSTEEFNTVQAEVVALAQRTRTDLGATAELYARVARSTEDLGATQREVLTFTESVNQALQISGATAAEAGAGVIQFAQGLASGALRGDELRSVMEQMPRLASALADNLGITIGELRKLGEQGKLTSEAVFDAILKAGPELQAEFEQITPTLGQAITTVKNFATVVIGEFNDAAGITTGLVDIFKLTDEQTVELGAAVRNLALDFREFTEVAVVAVANLIEKVAPAFNVVQAEIVKIIAAITRDEALFAAALAGQDEFLARIDEIETKLQDEFDAIRRNAAARRADAEAAGADLDAARGGGGAAGSAPLTEAQKKLIKQQDDLLEKLMMQEAALVIVADTGREYADVMLEMQINTLAASNANLAFAFDANETREAIIALNEEIKAAGDAEKERQNRIAEAAAVTADARTEQEIFNDEIERLQGLLKDGLISEETFERSVQNLNDFDDNFQAFLDRAKENSQDILAEFFSGGFESLDDFGEAFAKMLQQLAAQALAAGIFKALFGEGQGGQSNAGAAIGALGSILGGAGRQFGGGVQAGQAVTAAEGGRFGSEVFVPNQGGKVIPIGGDRGGMAAAAPPQVNVTSVNALDDSEIVGSFQEGAGDTVLLNRMSVRRNAFKRALGI
jgi:tape measure domain-containing protein